MSYETQLRTRVAERRGEHGLTLTALAEQIGLSRQGLTLIEAGRSTPSTMVALKLADALGCRVEDLFALEPEGLEALVVPELAGRRVWLGRVGRRWRAHGLAIGQGGADGVVEASGRVTLLGGVRSLELQALVAGGSPLLGVLAAEGQGGARWVEATSRAGLALLADEQVHLAGIHLADASEPEEHERVVREVCGARDVRLIQLHGWRAGLAYLAGAELGSVAALLRPGLRVARRPVGSGAERVLLRALAQAGGAEAVLDGVLVGSAAEAAWAVRSGAVEVAVLPEPVAQAHGLGFLPLCEERFELACLAEHLGQLGVQRLLNRATSGSFRREVAGMGAYDLTAVGDQRRVRRA